MVSMMDVLTKVLLLISLAFLTTGASGRRPKFQALIYGPEVLLSRMEEVGGLDGVPGGSNILSDPSISLDAFKEKESQDGKPNPMLSEVDKEKENLRKDDDGFSRAERSTRNDSDQAFRETKNTLVAKNVSFSQSRSTGIMTDRIVPVMDSSNLISMTIKSGAVFYEHHHMDVTIAMRLFPKLHDCVMPLNSTHLPGQSLLWNHSENDILDEYVGMEIHPPLLSSFFGVIVHSKVNGISRKFLAFQYEMNGTRYSFEPDSMYFHKKLNRLESQDKATRLETQNFLEIRHLLYEIKDGIQNEIQEDITRAYVNLVIVADHTIFKQFAELQKDNESSQAEALAEAESYLMALENLMNVSAITFTEKKYLHATVVGVFVLKDAGHTQFIERARVAKDLIEGEMALRMYERDRLALSNSLLKYQNSDHVVVALTKHEVEEEGRIVTGVHTEGLTCRGSAMIITHKEIHETENTMRNFLKNMLHVEAVKSSHLCEEKIANGSSCNPMDAVVEVMGKCMESQTQAPWRSQPMDVHTQCKVAFGPQFVACRSNRTICQFLSCKRKADKEDDVLCVHLPNMKALPRTPCDNGKSCLSENCNVDVLAPPVYVWPVEPVYEDPKTPVRSFLENMIVVTLAFSICCLILGSVLCAMMYKTLGIVKELRHNAKDFGEQIQE